MLVFCHFFLFGSYGTSSLSHFPSFCTTNFYPHSSLPSIWILLLQLRKIIDKRYEDKHHDERKAKSMVWGTSIPRRFAEEVNDFLKKYGFTKVQLIEAGYKALIDEAAMTDLSLAKIMDGYDDFFEFEKVGKKTE